MLRFATFTLSEDSAFSTKEICIPVDVIQCITPRLTQNGSVCYNDCMLRLKPHTVYDEVTRDSWHCLSIKGSVSSTCLYLNKEVI